MAASSWGHGEASPLPASNVFPPFLLFFQWVCSTHSSFASAFFMNSFTALWCFRRCVRLSFDVVGVFSTDKRGPVVCVHGGFGSVIPGVSASLVVVCIWVTEVKKMFRWSPTKFSNQKVVSHIKFQPTNVSMHAVGMAIYVLDVLPTRSSSLHSNRFHSHQGKLYGDCQMYSSHMANAQTWYSVPWNFHRLKLRCAPNQTKVDTEDSPTCYIGSHRMPFRYPLFSITGIISVTDFQHQDHGLLWTINIRGLQPSTNLQDNATANRLYVQLNITHSVAMEMTSYPTPVANKKLYMNLPEQATNTAAVSPGIAVWHFTSNGPDQ